MKPEKCPNCGSTLLVTEMLSIAAGGRWYWCHECERSLRFDPDRGWEIRKPMVPRLESQENRPSLVTVTAPDTLDSITAYPGNDRVALQVENRAHLAQAILLTREQWRQFRNAVDRHFDPPTVGRTAQPVEIGLGRPEEPVAFEIDAANSICCHCKTKTIVIEGDDFRCTGCGWSYQEAMAKVIAWAEKRHAAQGGEGCGRTSQADEPVIVEAPR